MSSMSKGLALPAILAAGYLLLLRKWYLEMQGQYRAGSDPFQHCWWGGPIIATVAYLAGVGIGPRVMRNRHPYSCRSLMIVYNGYQVALNVWTVATFCKEVAGLGQARGLSVWGNSFSRDHQLPGSFLLSYGIWAHYNNKYMELLDTAFMVLRKKGRQISVLHVYHHLLMIWAWFLVVKVACGGDAYFGACVNSFIHVIMYSYYLLTLLGVPCPWKRHLTQLQMGQFAVCLGHSAYVLATGNMPAVLPLVQAFVMLNMLVLFLRFYRSNYNRKAAAKRAQ